MAKYNFIVFTNATPGQEQEFNRWYDEIHLPEVASIPGIVGGRRLALAGPADGQDHRYLAIYDLETDDPGAVLAEIGRRMQQGEFNMSDTLADDSRPMLFKEITPFYATSSR
jgi:hypothetical protein